jgi:hypothetical protein
MKLIRAVVTTATGVLSLVALAAASATTEDEAVFTTGGRRLSTSSIRGGGGGEGGGRHRRLAPPMDVIGSLALVRIDGTVTTTVVSPMLNGTTIVKDALGVNGASLNIEAFLNGTKSDIKSLRYNFDNGSFLQTENLPRWAMCGNNGDTFLSCGGILQAEGTHALTITPYSGPNLSGEAGTPYKFVFTVVKTQVSRIQTSLRDFGTSPLLNFLLGIWVTRPQLPRRLRLLKALPRLLSRHQRLAPRQSRRLLCQQLPRVLL